MESNAIGLALRRVRLLTLIVLFGAFGLILTQGASWTSSFVVLALVAIAGLGGAAIALWRHSGKPNGT